ncbi:MAG: hypothetical protein RL148_400 [Planctomycetota bacterium]|jgi:uncharacterized membrane protein
MDFKLNRGGMPQVPPQMPVVLMVPGFLLGFFGLLLIYNPDLVGYIVGGILMVLGGLLFLAGMRMKRMLG